MITFKIENSYRKFDYNKEKMTLTVSEVYRVDKEDIPKIIENINELNMKKETRRDVGQ